MLKKALILLFIVLYPLNSLAISVSAVKDEVIPKAAELKEEEYKETLLIAKVVKVISDGIDELPNGVNQRSQTLLLEISSGKEKGKERVTVNAIPINPAFAIVGEVGKKYLVTKVEDQSSGDEEYFIVDYHRENYIWTLALFFLVIIVLIGGFKGVRTIVSLVLTILCIAYVLVPSIEDGVSPLLSAVFVSFLATAITMLLVTGWNMKSLAATVGTVVGVGISGLLASFVINSAPLSGLSNAQAMVLWGSQYDINFQGLLAAGMIVSCLGAIMDVAISISSSIQEIKLANSSYTLKQLFDSGMNVGKDIIGTMTNTLVLAYTGMAIPLLLLLRLETDPRKFLNLEIVVSEITAAIAGSIGLVIAVPITAIIMSVLLTKKENND